MLCLLCCYCLMFDVLDPTSAHPIVIFGEVICLDISSIYVPLTYIGFVWNMVEKSTSLTKSFI